jgi:hypothetical protein
MHTNDAFGDVDHNQTTVRRMEWITTTQVLQDLRESGGTLAWTRFRDHFYPMVLNFAKRLGLNNTDSEDAAQETCRLL